jgi:broad specificity phosphatase PhoE
MKTFLFRHGESTYNREGRVQGWTDASVLTDEGRSQSVQIAQFFQKEGLDELWSSDLPRAVQTAEEMLTVLKDTKHSVSTLLRERAQGIFEGRPYTDPEWQAAQARTERPPEEGETREVVLARMREFFAALAARNLPPDTRIGVISHGGAIRIFLEELGERQKGKIPSFQQGDIAEMDSTADHFSLQRIFSLFS